MTAQDLIAFETEIADLFNAAKIRAPIHLYYGNEEKMIELFRDDETDRQLVIVRILHALVEDACLAGHFAGEAMHHAFLAAPFETQRRADSDGDDATDDG